MKGTSIILIVFLTSCQGFLKGQEMQFEHLVSLADSFLNQRHIDSAAYYVQAAMEYRSSDQRSSAEQMLQAMQARLKLLEARQAEKKLYQKKAFRLYSSAFELAKGVRERIPLTAARASSGVGRNHPDSEAGLAFLREALTYFIPLKDSVQIRGCYLNASIDLHDLGRLEQSRRMAEMGLEWVPDKAYSSIRPRLNLSLSKYYTAIGNQSAALFYLQTAHADLLEHDRNDVMLYVTVRMLGTHQREASMYDESIMTFLSMVTSDLNNKSKHRAEIEATMLGEAGTSALAAGDLEKATKYLNRAIQNTAVAGIDDNYLGQFPAAELARVYAAKGELQVATSRIETVMTLLGKDAIYHHPDYALICLTVAKALIEIGRATEAQKYLEDGMLALHYNFRQPANYSQVFHYDILADLFNILSTLQNPNTSEADYALDQHLIFLDSIDQFDLQPSARLAIYEEHFHVYEKAIGRIFERYHKSQDQEAVRKAINISERSKAIVLREFILKSQARRDPDIPQDLLQSESDLYQRLSDIEMQLFTLESSENRNAEKLNQEKQGIHIELERISREINHMVQYSETAFEVPDWTSLFPDEAILEFFDGTHQDFAFLVTADHLEMLELPKENLPLLSTFRTVCAEDFNTKWEPLASQLYTSIAPLLEGLTSEIKRLTIIPSGDWAYLPFEVLAISPEKLLIDKFAIRYADAWHVLSHQKRNTYGSKSMVAFQPEYQPLDFQNADTMGTQQFALLVRSGAYALPGAQAEVDQINAITNGSVFRGQKASETNFKLHASQYALLHLSMHAVLEESDPQRSRMIFTRGASAEEDDDDLYAAELAGMQLSADMAVLSACNTGTGKLIKGEGVMSLSRAFQYAGVPSVVHSLWKVPDAATAKIMISFYKNLKQGMDKASALRQAKIDLRERAIAPQERHPYYWAGFVVNGNITPVHFEKPGLFQKNLYWIILLAVVALLGAWIMRKSSGWRNKPVT